MKRTTFAMLGILALGFWLAGCSKSNNGPTGPSVSSQDQQTLNQTISSEALLTSDATYLNDGDVVLGKVDTAIYPWYWGRKIDTAGVSRSVTYATVNDSTVRATVTTTVSGIFWIRGSFTFLGAHQTFRKPFTETFTRNVIFVRYTNANTPNIKWRMAEISAVKGGSANPGFSISSVAFVTPTDSLSMTDPNNTYLRVGRSVTAGGLPTLNADSALSCKVYVTVVSASVDSDLVTMHHPYWSLGGWHFRSPLKLISSVDNGNGTYTRVYARPWRGVWPGRHHVYVSVISRGTLFDNVAPFASQVWGVPLIVN